MTKVHSHAEITIRRTSGEVETVKHPAKLNDALFARIKAATKAAGKGDCLSYTLHTKDVELHIEGYAEALAAERAHDAHVASVYRAMDHKGNQ
jgi:hypothetical protein